ncbi:MAG: hypothetical protein Q9220_000076 [cf. Caloplaca sp. 1 TL-2023]
MESYASRNQHARYRQPLTETTNWVNNQTPTPPRPSKAQPSSPSSNIPHHESLKPGGTLQARINPSSPLSASAAVNKRVSAVSNEEKHNANRDSQISTASTTASGNSRLRKTHIGPWQLGKTIGKGSSGRVRKARHAWTSQYAAIKIVSRTVAEKLRTTSFAQMENILPGDHYGRRLIPHGIQREIIIMRLIEHPNVIRLYDVREHKNELYLVLEYVEGGELFDHIANNGGLPEEEAIRIFRQIIAGLEYCHRFNICHRDLKPENILLDRDRNVKIIDFGMAVLQQENVPLQTSCGSPHYAAPEIIRGQQYRGDRADIWSCGVILYAMLAGSLPFDSDGDWDAVVQAVLSGQYEFPQGMSSYGQDLIYRMLQMNPRRRIPIKEMWLHPLLKRYEHLDSLDANGQVYIGPLEPLTVIECGPPLRSFEQIDIDLLGNLQNLYGGLDEDELVKRLLSEGPNREKVLYTKLLKYAEEYLEDYQGPEIEYSSSDYHHRPKFNRGHVNQTQVTILHTSSVYGSSLNQRALSKASSQRPKQDQPLDNEEFSILSSPPAACSSQLARLRNDRRMSRASSRHTFASSTGTRVVHKSASYRRAVVFNHNRKRSVSADTPSQSLRYSSSLAPGATPLQHRASSNPLPSVPDSPHRTTSPVIPNPAVRSRKAIPDEDAARKIKIASQYWKEDTRKVSRELGNFCDEAFNRVSVASSTPTTMTAGTDGRSIGTPATSRSIHDVNPIPAGVRRMPKKSDLKAYDTRPLPRPPEEENLGSFTHRELARTRDILAKQVAISDISPGYLDEVIAHLDRLMQPSAVRMKEENRRAVTSPDPRYPGLPSNKDTFERFLEGRDYRSTSDPTAESPNKRRRYGDTVRTVDDHDQKPISPVKPLNIRKQSGSSTPSTETLRRRSPPERLPLGDDARYYDNIQSGGPHSAGLNTLEKSLAPIEEHAGDRANYEPTARTVAKKKSWFFRGSQTNKSQEMPPPPLPSKDQAHQGFQNFGGRKETPLWKRASDPTSEASQNSDSKKVGTIGKEKLLRFFGKRDVKGKYSSQEFEGDYNLEDDASFISASSTSQQPYLMSGALPQSTSNLPRHHRAKQYPNNNDNKSSLSMLPPPTVPTRTIQPQHHNWLMKFLRIKPAVTIIPFQVSRIRARKEIVGILKDWRKYGMRDIIVDKATERVWAKVGVKNSLHIRPVCLAIELFTVLEHGRKANLSLVKITQEKGAKSSFERVVRALEGVLREKGYLVEDQRRAAGMKRILMS